MHPFPWILPRLGAGLVAAGAAIALTASPAAADSIAYVKGGNVWLSTTDGARQFQVTSGGGYQDVAQADDGTLVATVAANSHLRKLDRLGNVLADFATPVSDHSTGGLRTFQGPFDIDVAPSGAKAAYGFIESGLFQDPSTGEISSETKNGAGFTRLDRTTSFIEDGFRYSTDWDAPEFVDDTHVLVSNGPSWPSDTIAVETVGSGDPVGWFSDGAVPHPMQASISRNKRMIAVVSGPARGEMRIYRDTNGVLGTAAGQPLNVEACFVFSGSEGFGSPTFSADGRRMWFETADGLETTSFDNPTTACGTGHDSVDVVAGGRSPDWGPADVPAARPTPPPTGGDQVGTPTTRPPVLRIGMLRLRTALAKGLTVRVSGAKPGRRTLTLKLGRRTVGTGVARVGADGRARAVVRFTRSAKRTLAHRQKVTLTLVGAGAKRTVKLKR